MHTPTKIIDEEKGSFVCSLSVTTEVFGLCSQPARTQAKLSCFKWLVAYSFTREVVTGLTEYL